MAPARVLAALVPVIQLAFGASYTFDTYKSEDAPKSLVALATSPSHEVYTFDSQVRQLATANGR